MEEIRSKATRHIMFIDDNFIGDPAFARELLEAMRPLRLKWSAAVSANVADMPDLLDLMRDTGCRSLFVGFESLRGEALANVHKTQNRTAEALYDGYLKVYRDIYSFPNILRRLPRTPAQILPYLLFNFLYRKYGHLTERLGRAIGFDRVGALARRLSYWR